MADTEDLKSSDLNDHKGSSPFSGTIDIDWIYNHKHSNPEESEGCFFCALVEYYNIKQLIRDINRY